MLTYEEILQRMLKRVPDSMDKRTSAIIYSALAPAAAELAQMYIEAETIMNQTFADTATDEYLTKRCAERGIIRQDATFALVEGVFTPVDVNVIGQRFSCGRYNYIVTAATETAGTYQLTCETAGSEPNGVTGQLIPIDHIPDLQTASVTSILIPGEDEEDDDDLRSRYYTSLDSQAFGGNPADYIEKTNKIPGVGGTKVTPVWNGPGTVKLTIIASDYSIPSNVLIGVVQEDMTASAVIGHDVTVVGVTGVTINIATEITYQSGWSWGSTGTYIENAIDEYFTELAETWANSEQLVVRISGIEQKILSCAGVVDVANTTLNGAAANIQLGANEVPVRGSVADGS